MGLLYSKDDQYMVLPATNGGGPMGYGDPEDRSLRQVETEVMIPLLAKHLVQWDRCLPEAVLLERCSAEKSWQAPIKCRSVVNDLRVCEKRWFSSEAFREECTERYLNERSEYRRTGKRVQTLAGDAVKARVAQLRAELDSRKHTSAEQ